MKKRISKGLQPPFFVPSNTEISSLENAENRGKTNCKKCLQVKARHQTCRANPSNPRSAGIFPAPRLASKTEGCHQAGHLSKGRNENVLRK